MSTIEENTLQDIIQAAIKAEDAGVPVNWKEICLAGYQAAVAEIRKLQDENNTLFTRQQELFEES